MKMVVGIDEAGRGPLAGPVTVAAFCAPQTMEKDLMRIIGGKIKDSKQLTHEKRVHIYKKLLGLQKEGRVNFSITHVSHIIIDKGGISKAVARGIASCLKKLHHKNSRYQGHPGTSLVGAFVRLDGLLWAPSEYKNQKTIVKGDEKDVFIACASIVAKVARDALMCRLAKKYPVYRLDVHKGYGTRVHRQALIINGLSAIHRRSFCKNINIV